MTTLVAGTRRALTHVDRVWGSIALLFVGLALLAPANARQTFVFTAESFAETGPYLLLAVLAAAYARASSADRLIAAAFTGAPLRMVALAAIIGALSPFCSCGVIPLIAALLAMGVPLAPVMAFWLASPIMDPTMFVLTWGTLGLDYALIKTVAAMAIGLAGGYTLLALQARGWFADALRPGVGDGGCGGQTVRERRPVVWAFWHEGDRRERFGREAARSALFLAKWLIIAFALEALMLAHVPAEWIGGAMGGSGWVSIPLATIVGVPAYLNGYAALPLVEGLLAQGMTPGAAVAFMIAGGVTCIPAAVAVFALVKRPVFAAYIALALVGAVISGIAAQIVLT